MDVHATRAEVPDKPGNQRQLLAGELGWKCRLDLLARVFRDEPDPVIAARRQAAMRADAQRCIDGLAPS